MTPQQITEYGLRYHRTMRELGVRVSQDAIRYFNGGMEYLTNIAQALEHGEDLAPEHQPGAPYSQDYPERVEQEIRG